MLNSTRMPRFLKSIPAALPEPESIDVKALAASLAKGDYDLVCVLGPTASGKTRYAVRLAGSLESIFASLGAGKSARCEIISADSRQVYRGMDIGTGKDIADYEGVPYHLIDIAEPGEQYNVYRFCEDFEKAYADIKARGNIPILCGGTGLYINAVGSGYDFRSRKPLSAPAAIQDKPSEADVAPVGTKRIFYIGTLVSREERNARIDSRLKARLEEGMVDEIRGLLDRGVPAQTLISYGLEYKFVTLYLQGELTEEELFVQLSTAIHQFAKRQMTWFRGMERSGIRIHWTEV